MFNQFKVIWYGLGGAFAGFHPVETKIPLYIAGFLFSAGVLLMNSFISLSFDRDTVWQESVGLSYDQATVLAVISTVLLAIVAMFFISYLALLASAKAHKRRNLLIGISRWGVFFTLLAVVAVLTIEIYRNYHGSEDIAESHTEQHMVDPTSRLDTKYQSQEESVKEDYTARIGQIQAKIALINRWTGKRHSCTKTGCPTIKKGKGTVGSHWKGTLTAVGSEQLAILEKRIQELEAERNKEVAIVRERRATVLSASVNAFKEDVSRYKAEIQLKNNTFKGFVFIAFPAAFIISFLLSDITYMGMEYLYESGRLERPIVTGFQDGLSVVKTAAVTRDGTSLTEEIVDQRFKARQCVNCGTDISHKRRDAKACSDSCRISYNEWKNGYSVAAIRKRKRKAG